MISVIIPVHNVEKYLPLCIESVVNQTYKNIEIICVNDGSTDSSLAILESFAEKDRRIKIINQESTGPAGARNAGLDLATGDFVYFLDSDDFIKPRAFEVLRGAIGERDAALANFTTVDENLKQIKNRFAKYHFKRDEIRVLLPSELDSIFPAPWGKLFKKRRIDRLKLRFPTGLHYEDVYWHWVYFSENCSVSVVVESLYYYRQRSGSIMDNTLKGESSVIHERLLITERVLHFYKERGLLKQLPSDLVIKLLEKSVTTSLRFSTNQNKFLVCETLKRIVDLYNLNAESSVLLHSILKNDWTLVFSSVDNFTANVVFYKFLKKYPKKSAVRKLALSIMRKLS